MASLVGASNPNWKGGHLHKTCSACAGPFTVRPGRPDARFCSLQCVGVSQRGQRNRSKQVAKACGECGASYSLPRSHAGRSQCCSRRCAGIRRARLQSGGGNGNWQGGISRLPYPWDFRFVSRAIIARDGHACQNPSCAGTDPRLTAHHIDYDKANCALENLIALCSACNSKANFSRPKWQAFYAAIMRAAKHGGGWDREEFS